MKKIIKSGFLKIFVAAIIIVGAIVFASHSPKRVSAQAAGGGGGMQDFWGGSIKKVTYCTCYYYPGEVMQVNDLTNSGGGSGGTGGSSGSSGSGGGGGQTKNVFFSYFFSKLDENYNIWEAGPNTIGGYISGAGECLDTSGYYCRQNSSAGQIDGMVDFIRGVGSSLEGSQGASGQ